MGRAPNRAKKRSKEVGRLSGLHLNFNGKERAGMPGKSRFFETSEAVCFPLCDSS
jgi:hypothetical protein